MAGGEIDFILLYGAIAFVLLFGVVLYEIVYARTYNLKTLVPLAKHEDLVTTREEELRRQVQEATEKLQKANEELQRLDATKDEFVSMASHQLRTPLTSIKGYLSMVLEGDAGKITSDQRKLLAEAFMSSERMVHLIGDFLNVSRLQNGKFIIDHTKTDLAEIVQQEILTVREIAAAKGVGIAYHHPSRFPVLYLDEDKIRQVVMNLLDNAVFYSGDSKVISVRLYTHEGYAVLEVVDHGIGVPKAAQKHLFTKFYRAANAQTQRPDGTGVGLYLAKKVVTGHSGRMVFHSVEGEGSTFGFRLPIKKLSVPPTQGA